MSEANDCKKLPIHQISVDLSLQHRKINRDTVNKYSYRYSNNLPMPPLIVYFDGIIYRLVSGFHQLEALKLAKKSIAHCRIVIGGYQEAYIASLQSNSDHGLPLDKDDQINKTMKVLNDPQIQSLNDHKLIGLLKITEEDLKLAKKRLQKRAKYFQELSILSEPVQIDFTESKFKLNDNCTIFQSPYEEYNFGKKEDLLTISFIQKLEDFLSPKKMGLANQKDTQINLVMHSSLLNGISLAGHKTFVVWYQQKAIVAAIKEQNLGLSIEENLSDFSTKSLEQLVNLLCKKLSSWKDTIYITNPLVSITSLNSDRNYIAFTSNQDYITYETKKSITQQKLRFAM